MELAGFLEFLLLLYLSELEKPEFLPRVSLGLEDLPRQFYQFDAGEAGPVEVIASNLSVVRMENKDWESSLLTGDAANLTIKMKIMSSCDIVSITFLLDSISEWGSSGVKLQLQLYTNFTYHASDSSATTFSTSTTSSPLQSG